MKKAFIMTSDALIAFLIISISLTTTQFLLKQDTSEKSNYLHALTNDAATLIEYSETENLPEILNIAPSSTCLKAVIRKYEGLSLKNERIKSTKGCPESYTGEVTVSSRTFINNEENYLIIIQGWYKWTGKE